MKTKTMKRLVCVTMLFALLMVGTSYAAFKIPVSWEELSEGKSQSVLLPSSQIQSVGTTKSVARGKVFSAGIVEISNMQDGTLYVAADTFAHSPVEKIYQTIFLDKWDDDLEDWVQIKYWEFERGSDEEPNLTSYHVEMIVSGCKLNKYYRARAMHLVQVGDTYEGKATETNGVLLTDHET